GKSSRAQLSGSSGESASGIGPGRGEKVSSQPKESTVQLPPYLVEQARRVGIDVASYCENSLARGVRALKGAGLPGDASAPDGSGSPAGRAVPGGKAEESLRLEGKTRGEIVKDFKDFCGVDLDLADSTVQRHLAVVRDFLDYFDDLSPLTKGKVREYLKERKRNEAKATYANRIKALRRLLRDFLESPELIEGFKLPRQEGDQIGTDIVDKGDLQEFYKHIDSLKYEAIFLFKASSGLRLGEVTALTVDSEDVDFEKRMVTPNHDSPTKKSYLTFYNSEAEEKLGEFLPEREKGDDRLFQTNERTVQKSFRRTSKRAGIRITPKMLREWFSKEMRNLGVAGEHIDAFCGRLPKSVRGRHYTDFSEGRLKEVYEEADIKILD
ncbi:hypothetical protein AKJ62_04350, partial [candidate division MSBL1 archaeon SCGC-AAA259D14]